VDATRGRSRPPPPPRHPPLTAAIAAISAPITSATPVAITTFRVRHHRRHRSLPTTLSRRPARAGAPWHRHHRLHRLPSTVDFEGPPLPQPSPPSPPSPLPPYWPQPPALPGVATCGKAFWPFRPQCKKNGLVTATFLGPTVELEGHIFGAIETLHPVTFRCHCLAGAGSRVQDCPLLVR
jgi:hypothetical protein